MARNIEIKARIPSAAALLPKALACTQGRAELIAQDDTFFASPVGRLKLRAFADGSGELIAYDRADATGPKVSDYTIAPVADPVGLRAVLARSLGVTGRVVKRRHLVRLGPTRLHLDQVEGLGDFLELEVVLQDDQPAEDGVAIAHAWLARFDVDRSQLVAGAYVDLLRERPGRLEPGTRRA